MFEVQLGAAVLLQTEDTAGALVRVLADGGIRPSGRYLTSHVNGKLAAACQDFDRAVQTIFPQTTPSTSHRIDLLLGTHYDQDHLRGLIDVAKNVAIEITEAWLPPIQQSCLSEDSIISTANGDLSTFALEECDLGDDAGLRRYLDSQNALCKVCARAVSELNEIHEISDSPPDAELEMPWFSIEGPDPVDTVRHEEADLESSSDFNLPEELAQRLAAFRRYLLEADAQLPNRLKGSHENSISEAQNTELRMSLRWPPVWAYRAWRRGHLSSSKDPKLAKQHLAYIQKTSAKKAIVAIWLNQLVTELRNRSPHVIISSQSISQSIPEYFVWDRSSKRFLHNSSGHATSSEPKVTLLGPSHELISKHQTLLPIGSYMALLGFVPIKRILPSNELSYTLLFESSSQQILLTGDAGCVDFRDRATNKYFKTMLDAIGEPNVVQVAHHAGNNADFYNVLLRSNYAASSRSSYLLLSHATHDKLRPSQEFKTFLDVLTKASAPNRQLYLLFTSEPLNTNATVTSHANLFHPIVGAKAQVGDVQIVYTNGAWKVTKHAIA